LAWTKEIVANSFLHSWQIFVQRLVLHTCQGVDGALKTTCLTWLIWLEKKHCKYLFQMWPRIRTDQSHSE
jgi:hypothetical protein